MPRADNRIKVVEFGGGVVTWLYDKTNQLANERRTDSGHPTYNATFTYDKVGNRLSINDSGAVTTYLYDAANELVREQRLFAVTTYGYDKSGNRIRKNAPGATTFYTWDALQRLTVADPVAGPVTMSYDAPGHRVRKHTPTEDAHFLYDFERVLHEADGTGTTVKEYTSTEEEFGHLLSQYETVGGSHYFDFDGAGSTAALTNPLQNPTDSYRYPAHARTMARIADQWARSGKYRLVAMDKAINKWVPGASCDPNIEPDVLGIRWDGKVDLLEVVSPEAQQTIANQTAKLDLAREQLSSRIQGDIKAVLPQEVSSEPK